LRFQSLSDRDACGGAATLSTGAPLNEVQSFGKSIPIVVAFRVARNRQQFPIAVDLDLLNDVDAGHGSTSWA
jgi:alpha-D-ribose 1-methylphosphonate 5-triphosphate synthase subunit PhnH